MQELPFLDHFHSELLILKKVFDNLSMLFGELIHDMVCFVMQELGCFPEYNRFQVLQLLFIVNLNFMHLCVAQLLIPLNSFIFFDFS